MSWSVMQKNKSGYLHGKGHSDGLHNQNMTVLSSFLFWFDQLGFMVEHYKPKSSRSNGLLCSRSRSQQRFSISINVCPDQCFIPKFKSLLTCPPKGGRGCRMSLSCLDSQGCHLTPFSCLLFFCLVLLLFLSCHFSANGPFS